MTKVPMTVTGAQRLKAELHRLKTTDRPDVIRAIEKAEAPAKVVPISPFVSDERRTSEVRDQKSEVSGQRSEVRGQGSRVRSQRAIAGG